MIGVYSSRRHGCEVIRKGSFKYIESEIQRERAQRAASKIAIASHAFTPHHAWGCLMMSLFHQTPSTYVKLRHVCVCVGFIYLFICVCENDR